MSAVTSLSKVPPVELAIIRQGVEVEREWWKHRTPVRSQADVSSAVRNGVAVRVPLKGKHYRISARAPKQLHVLDACAYRLLRDVAEMWHAKLEEDDEELFLVVSSLARTPQRQALLRRRGFPAVEDSTHLKLVAFDIAVAWFLKHRPRAYRALQETLDMFSERGFLNHVHEPSIGVMHVCMHPSYAHCSERRTSG